MQSLRIFVSLAFCLVLLDAKAAEKKDAEAEKVEVESKVLQSLVTKIEQDKADIANLRYEMALMRQPSTRHCSDDEIAFNVLLSHDFGPVSQDTKIPFDVVYHNKGNCWDAAAYTFVAPKTGFYFFTASIAADVGQTARAAILYVPSPTKMVSLVATGGGDSNQVLLALGEGSTVSVQLSSGDAGVLSSADDYYVTFSGFLLW